VRFGCDVLTAGDETGDSTFAAASIRFLPPAFLTARVAGAFAAVFARFAAFGFGSPFGRETAFRAEVALFFFGGLFARAGLREATGRAAYPGSGPRVRQRVGVRELA
jgi:hypothetical protein